jgi:cytochrome c-type biogenesis protein CcmH
MVTYFWYGAGILTGFAAAFVMLPLARALAQKFPGRGVRFAVAALAVVGFGAATLIVYRTLGSPDAVEQSLTAVTPPHPGARTPAPGEQGQSLENAASKLEERLTRDGGSISDWQLLAQTYEVLGRPDDAARVRAQAASAAGASGATPPAASDTRSTQALEARVREAPGDTNAWLELATIYRHQRKFPESRSAFERVIARNAMTADSWADYADVLATLAGGSLAGAPARAIDRALAIDAHHPKALWLKASLAHEQHRYGDSLAVWKQLRATLPANSPDVAIIEANIAEAAALAKLPAGSSETGPAPVAVQVSGTVSVDKALAARVVPGATLFIYAKAADSPGPPLAVFRTSPTSWPVSFRLDDSLAMMPARKLSDFTRVIVEARLSRSGQALPVPGDLYVESPVLQPAEGKRLDLVISRVIS